MAITGLSKNWSTALWHMLEPRALLTASIAGLRLVLDKLGGIAGLATDAVPVGRGSSYLAVTVPLSDIVSAPGVTAGDGITEAVSGSGGHDLPFRVVDLPTGILLFAKSASAIDDVLMRGIDFVETVTGCYRFKSDPSFFGVCSSGGGAAQCTWICTIGTATNTGNQDRLGIYKGSTVYRINKQLDPTISSVEGSGGHSNAASVLCAGADLTTKTNNKVSTTWQEGDALFCLTADRQLIKLPSINNGDIKRFDTVEDYSLSNVLLYSQDGRYYSMDVSNDSIVDHPLDVKSFEDLVKLPIDAVKDSASVVKVLLSRNGFNTIDSTDLVDGKVCKLIDPLVSKVSTVFTTQQLNIDLRKVTQVDELYVYYANDSTVDIWSIAGTSAGQCVINAASKYGGWIMDSGDVMVSGRVRWCTLNAESVGMFPKCGHRIVGVSAVQHASQESNNGDILEHVDIVDEFIHPGSCLIITATIM